jgi:hypothetical protein
MLANWADVKSVLTNRGLSAQYTIIGTNFWIKAIDRSFEIECILPTDTSLSADSLDFVTNFQPTANQSPNVLVTTQFEQKQYTLQLACASANVGEDGTVTILMKIPGTPGGTDGRYINAGEAFFDSVHAGDKILGTWFVDHDNILGGGVDVVVGSYTDDAASSENQGWYISPVRGFVKAETVGFYGFAPAGFYVKIVGKKGGGITSGTLYLNMEWAIKNS